MIITGVSRYSDSYTPHKAHFIIMKKKYDIIVNLLKEKGEEIEDKAYYTKYKAGNAIIKDYHNGDFVYKNGNFVTCVFL